MPNKILKTLEIAGTPYDVPQGTGTVTGVKGQQETTYRDGNVNLTPDNVAFLGNNITGGTANDTSAFWKAQGTGFAYINEDNQTYGQPHSYGMIYTTVRGNLIFQRWHGTNNQLFKRYANVTNVTNMPSWTAVDTTYSAGTGLDLTGTTFKIVLESINGSASNFNCANNTNVDKNLFTATKACRGVFSVDCTYAANATGVRGLVLMKNTTQVGSVRLSAAPTGTTSLNVSSSFSLANGDIIKARFYQSSGAALAVSNIDLDGYVSVN